MKMSSSSQTLYVFSDGKFIPIQVEMTHGQISNINNNILFRRSPAPIQVQSNNDEKKSNNNTMDQVQQKHAVQSLMDIAEQQPCNSNE